ncbi:FecR family protein [uncultured Sphingomonas sp.]|uniref:FecR family protein n=1 Tax=uncultured Sphingomonas sp. TaxID=158754 RepID=UPI00261E6D10|nr:FecR domain-containing protein [uncultured Sphingomonas sp.]
MTDIDDMVLDVAIGWHVRQAEMDESAWLDFVTWLESDPAHASAYDVVSIADAERHAATPAALPVAANDEDEPGVRRWYHRRRGFAMAAAALAAVVVGSVGLMEQRGGGAAPIEIAANGPRTLALADGTQVAMEAGARVAIGGGDQRSAMVESGRVTFRVTHDANRPFTVRVGDWEVQDIGTIFAITRGANGVDVSVSEGSVLFDPRNSRITLKAGEALTVLPGQRIMRSRVDSDRTRTLAFSGQPIGFVAESIGLVLERDVRASDRVAQMPFTGIVRLTGDAPRDMSHFAELTGMRVSHEGGGWIIASPGAPTR